MPRTRNPHVADQLVEAAARVLADEGRDAVTARRMATEVGTSTMAVYTHFGSMDDLLMQVWREGFARFGAALDGAPLSADPVADWVAQGWAYRRFALENRHLYRVMFGAPFVEQAARAEDLEVAAGAFESLLTRFRRASDAGRLVVDDLDMAGQVVWSAVHGHMALELAGTFVDQDRDARVLYTEMLRRLGLAYGDDPDALDRSLRAGDPQARAVTRR